MKQGNSKTVLPLFIGCNYKLHSLIPSHFCTNTGEGDNSFINDSVGSSLLYVTSKDVHWKNSQQSHKERTHLNLPQYFCTEFRTCSLGSCLQNYQPWELTVSCQLILEVLKVSLSPSLSSFLTSELCRLLDWSMPSLYSLGNSATSLRWGSCQCLEATRLSADVSKGFVSASALKTHLICSRIISFSQKAMLQSGGAPSLADFKKYWLLFSL